MVDLVLIILEIKVAAAVALQLQELQELLQIQVVV
tara:strand:- start:128 stop:232 length:105 start_codon:yes stop_codon:yes gene_type:complete